MSIATRLHRSPRALRRSPRRPALVLAPLVVMACVACGETVDLRDQATDTSAAATAVPVDRPVVDAPAGQLLADLVAAWQGLDQRVIDGDRSTETLERIEAIWRFAEPQLRDERPELLFGFEQAIDLARSSVERRRPADASKGYKLAVDLTNDYLTR